MKGAGGTQTAAWRTRALARASGGSRAVPPAKRSHWCTWGPGSSTCAWSNAEELPALVHDLVSGRARPHTDFAWQRAHLAAVANSATYAPTRDDWGPLIMPGGFYFALETIATRAGEELSRARWSGRLRQCVRVAGLTNPFRQAGCNVLSLIRLPNLAKTPTWPAPSRPSYPDRGDTRPKRHRLQSHILPCQ